MAHKIWIRNQYILVYKLNITFLGSVVICTKFTKCNSRKKKHWTDLFDIFSVKQVFRAVKSKQIKLKIRKHWWNIKKTYIESKRRRRRRRYNNNNKTLRHLLDTIRILNENLLWWCIVKIYYIPSHSDGI